MIIQQEVISDHFLRQVLVATRENPIVNRLNKTKVEREVDHEQEKEDRIRAEAAKRRVEAAAKVRFRIPFAVCTSLTPITFTAKSRPGACTQERRGEEDEVI